MMWFYVLASILFLVSRSDSTRLCPSGFHYTGEDTPGIAVARTSYWSLEIDRSPTYSCYFFAIGNGINDALHECKNQKNSEVVAFEDEEEAMRFFQLVFARQESDAQQVGNRSHRVMTSAMYFMDVKRWIWLGSDYNKTTIDYNITRNSSTEQCLAAVATLDGDDYGEIKIEWRAMECNKAATPFVCEARVETVTYLTWVYANWLPTFLMFLVLVMAFCLCVSAASYRRRGRRYRGWAATEIRRPHAPRGTVPKDPFRDQPPTYSDVAGKDAVPTGNPGLFDKYVARGKELMANVYLYKGK